MVLIGRAIRVLVGWLDLALHTFVMWALALLPRCWTTHWYPGLFPAWCRSFVRALRVDLRLHQHQRTPLPQRYLLVANHPSAFEDIGIPALFPVDSLAKEAVRDWWVVGRIAERAGTIFVQRSDKPSRREAADRIVHELLRGRCVAIYPEGGCQGRRLARRFHYGAFDIARRAGVPVVPVFIHYEAQECFEWLQQSLPRKILEIATAPNRRAHYHVFEPFWPEDYEGVCHFHDVVYAQYLSWQRRFI
jgi:1-acyl-sn-glycerol-3-phosphate acyltransferase